MTPDTIERLAETLVRNEVHCCLSGIVATLANGGGYGYGFVSDGLAPLCEQAADLAAPVDDWESAAREAGWQQSPEGWFWREPTEDDLDDGRAGFYFLGSGPFVRSNESDWQSLCEDEALEPYPREVYEHWAISQRLGEDLAAIGEKVDFDFAGLVVWARTTTGQAISMDSALIEVARRLRARNVEK